MFRIGAYIRHCVASIGLKNKMPGELYRKNPIAIMKHVGIFPYIECVRSQKL